MPEFDIFDYFAKRFGFHRIDLMTMSGNLHDYPVSIKLNTIEKSFFVVANGVPVEDEDFENLKIREVLKDNPSVQKVQYRACAYEISGMFTADEENATKIGDLTEQVTDFMKKRNYILPRIETEFGETKITASNFEYKESRFEKTGLKYLLPSFAYENKLKGTVGAIIGGMICYLMAIIFAIISNYTLIPAILTILLCLLGYIFKSGGKISKTGAVICYIISIISITAGRISQLTIIEYKYFSKIEKVTIFEIFLKLPELVHQYFGSYIHFFVESIFCIIFATAFALYFFPRVSRLTQLDADE